MSRPPDASEFDQMVRRLGELEVGMYLMYRDAGPDEPMLYLSPRAETIFGGDRERFVASMSYRRERIHPQDRARWEAASDEADRTGVWDLEYRIPEGDSVRWVHGRAHLVEGLTPRSVWLGWVMDVTAAHEAREALATSEEHYRDLVEGIPAAVFTLTNEVPARATYVSPQVHATLGYPVEAWLGDPDLWEHAMHPEDRSDVAAAWARAVADGTPFDEEYRLRHASGHQVWIREKTNPVRDANGDVIAWQGVSFDVTERHRAQDELARSEARYRDLVERLPVLVYVDSDDPDPTSLYVSPNVGAILGHEPATYLADRSLWASSMHPDDRDRVLRTWQASIASGEPFSSDYRVIRPDESMIWVRDRATPVAGDDGRTLFWQGLMEDITQRRLAQEEVQAARARFQALVEQLPAIVYVDSDDASERYVSPNVVEILGYPAARFHEEVAPWFQILHPEDHERVVAAWREAWDAEEPYELEYRFVAADGRTVWVRDSVRVVSREGRPTLWQGVLVDITHQKQVERAHELSERRFRALVEQIPAIVYEMGPDDDRRTLYVSPHAEVLLGYTRQEWLDQPDIWTELLHHDDREIELAAHDEANRTGEAWEREYRLIAADGEVVWVRDQAKLVRDPRTGDATWQGVMLDISRRRELEDRLRLVNDELELRVRERTMELADANELMMLEIGERRRVEAELRASDERYRTLLAHVPGVVYVWEVEHGDEHSPRTDGAAAGWHAYTSRQIETMLGYTAEEWQATRFWQSRLHPHDHDRIVALVERCQLTGSPFEAEYRYLARDGRVVWVLDRATMLSRDTEGRPHLYQGVMLDVTARHDAEDRVGALEDRQRRLVEESPGIAWIVSDRDDDPRVLWRRYDVSRRVTDILGYDLDEFAGPAMWTSLVHPDDRGRILESASAFWATGDPWADDLRMIAKDGHVVWLHVEGRALERDAEGCPIAYQGVMLDIDERKRHELSTLEERDRLRAVIDEMPAMPWTEEIDAASGTSTYTFIGPGAEAILGFSADELIAEPGHLRRMLHPADAERFLAGSRRRDLTGSWEDEFRIIRRDGAIRWLHGSGRRATPEGAGTAVWHGVMVDVTAYRADETDSTDAPSAHGSSER